MTQEAVEDLDQRSRAALDMVEQHDSTHTPQDASPHNTPVSTTKKKKSKHRSNQSATEWPANQQPHHREMQTPARQTAGVADLTQREIDGLYWRCVNAERQRSDLQVEVAEERLAAKKRMGYLERENDKLKNLLKDAASRLRSMRDQLDNEERGLTEAAQSAGITGVQEDGSGDDADDAERAMQRYHDAMQRIERGAVVEARHRNYGEEPDEVTHTQVVDLTDRAKHNVVVAAAEPVQPSSVEEPVCRAQPARIGQAEQSRCCVVS